MTRKSFLACLLSAFAAATVPLRTKRVTTAKDARAIVKGLIVGNPPYKHLSASNALKNRMLDAAFREASLVLQGSIPWLRP